MNLDNYLTARETADYLGLHLGSLANQRAAGRSPIEYVTVGRTVLYLRGSVERYAAERAK